MRTWFTYLAPLLICLHSFSQTNDQDSIIVCPVPLTESAEFPGGFGEFTKFFSKNFKLPLSDSCLTSKIYADFMIDTTGKVSDIRILKRVANCDAFYEEAIRVLSLMPPWKPALMNGKKVRERYRLPITVCYK